MDQLALSSFVGRYCEWCFIEFVLLLIIKLCEARHAILMRYFFYACCVAVAHNLFCIILLHKYAFFARVFGLYFFVDTKFRLN